MTQSVTDLGGENTPRDRQIGQNAAETGQNDGDEGAEAGPAAGASGHSQARDTGREGSETASSQKDSDSPPDDDVQDAQDIDSAPVQDINSDAQDINSDAQDIDGADDPDGVAEWLRLGAKLGPRRQDAQAIVTIGPATLSPEATRAYYRLTGYDPSALLSYAYLLLAAELDDEFLPHLADHGFLAWRQIPPEWRGALAGRVYGLPGVPDEYEAAGAAEAAAIRAARSLKALGKGEAAGGMYAADLRAFYRKNRTSKADSVALLETLERWGFVKVYSDDAGGYAVNVAAHFYEYEFTEESKEAPASWRRVGEGKGNTIETDLS